MENFYIILVVVLFALAISDLIVGVSNDAVNFLNSAIGSKAAPKWAIFLMASLGVLVGATFSNGMMEVARKGIFHPDMFFFTEIMVIFLAVMITDVILLDLFNTFGMPTSTTVSIVFELLGAAVAVAVVKIKTTGGIVAAELSNYINSEKALAIITGILLSVFIAFSIGALVMYITRFIFSFQYRKPMKYFGSAFGGLAITAITYFIFIKGMKGSSFADYTIASGETLQEWFQQNSGLVLLVSFGFWVVFIQLLKWVFKIKILKVVVMVGTFALAMAFAGNDLVNFIGVPVAGFKSFQAWASSGGVAPEAFSMEGLAGKSSTPIYMLLVSGLVMVITLILSKKARAVTETEISLGRQNEGTERFGSSLAARIMVRGVNNFNKSLQKNLPDSITKTFQSRFEKFSYYDNDPVPPAFDKIRASVNLVVASILIAIGTSLKLPLSTTYVTFMVAMGTSLSDRAWDRESAVYRISGVFAVIGGWFLTALIAFSVSGLIALVISLSGNFMIFIFVALAIFMVIRTQFIFKRRTAEKIEEDDDTIEEADAAEMIITKASKQVLKALVRTNEILAGGIQSFLKEDRTGLLNAQKSSLSFSKKAKKNKDKVYSTLAKLPEGTTADTSHFYVQMMEHKREMAHAVHFLLDPVITHFENNHKPFTVVQANELNELLMQISSFFELAQHSVKKEEFSEIDDLINARESIFEILGKYEKSQIKRIKNSEVNTRNSQLFFNINTEIKNILLHSVNLVKAERDFVLNTRKSD